MPPFAELSWEEVAAIERSRAALLLPVGATEAHGPHLPLATDVVIATAMAERAAERLSRRGIEAIVLPPVAYSVASYAASFAGTVSVRPETATALLVDVGRSLASHGFPLLAIANAHLEPAHIRSIDEAVRILEAEHSIHAVFPDVTKKPWVFRLTEEFKSGACHAGQYEGSIVMAVRPDLVKDALRRDLPPNPISLSQAIRAGKSTFLEAGGPRAYFGDPAAATADEGRATIDILGGILEEAIIVAMEPTLPGA